jgi:putative colanic acid biosynthesis UDP-glucose lipid carrier transferase
MNQHSLRSVRLLFIVLDLFVLNVMLFMGKSWFGDLPNSYDIEYYQLAAFMNISWLGMSWLKKLYQKKNLSSFEIFSRETMQTYGYFIIVLVLYLYFYKKIEISRLFIGLELVAIAIGFFLNRLISLVLIQYLSSKDFSTRKILIIGYNQTAKKLANYFEESFTETKIIGYCEDEENVHEVSHYPIVSELSDVMSFCGLHGDINEIYSTVSPEQNHYIYQLMQEADQKCIRFKIIPDLNLHIKQPAHITYSKDIPILSIRNEPLDDITNRIKKRVFDICLSGAILIFILSWMIPIIGLLIWIEDRGPVFFIQKRSGKNNKKFNCTKFRSMHLNTQADLKQATKQDERITRIGKLLRRTSLDEFPQFLNVFVGDMSIVGPRPHMLKHTDEYSKIINRFMIRQFVKPGVTGWAQINGYRGEVKTVKDIENRVEYDLWYSENWNLWFDTKIVFLTICKMIRGDKNAF